MFEYVGANALFLIQMFYIQTKGSRAYLILNSSKIYFWYANQSYFISKVKEDSTYYGK